MKLLIVLSSLLACSLGQLLYYSHPYSHPYSYPYSAFPYSPIAPLTTPYTNPYVRYTTPYTPAPVAAPSPIVTPVASQYRAQDELGQFTFATAGDNQARVETGLADGSVRGAYSYVDANGKLINVHYIADDNGFRVLGANNLPEAPAAPDLKGPEPVKDTPEVVAARAQFQKMYEEAAAAAAAAPEEPASEQPAPDQAAPSRRKRQVLYASPFVPAHVPALALAKTNVKVQELQPVEGAKVPASTRKVELKESEKEVTVAVPSYAAAHVAPVAPVAPSVYSVAPHVYSVAPRFFPVAPQVVAAPLPAVPVAKTTVKVQQFEPVEGAKVPASTRKLALKEREHEVVAPLPLSLPLPLTYPYYGHPAAARIVL